MHKKTAQLMLYAPLRRGPHCQSSAKRNQRHWFMAGWNWQKFWPRFAFRNLLYEIWPVVFHANDRNSCHRMSERFCGYNAPNSIRLPLRLRKGRVNPWGLGSQRHKQLNRLTRGAWPFYPAAVFLLLQLGFVVGDCWVLTAS